MRRALHFATREINERPRVVPFPATWLSYFIAYRAGMTLDAIAAAAGVERWRIAKRLRLIMETRDDLKIRDRLDRLVAEMGRVKFEDHQAEMLRFPGPPVLSKRRYVS